MEAIKLVLNSNIQEFKKLNPQYTEGRCTSYQTIFFLKGEATVTTKKVCNRTMKTYRIGDTIVLNEF